MVLKPEKTFTNVILKTASKSFAPFQTKDGPLKAAHHSKAAYPTTQDLVADIMSATYTTCYNNPFLVETWSMGILLALLRIQNGTRIFTQPEAAQDWIPAFVCDLKFLGDLECYH